jgi:hypothetical protein
MQFLDVTGSVCPSYTHFLKLHCPAFQCLLEFMGTDKAGPYTSNFSTSTPPRTDHSHSSESLHSFRRRPYRSRLRYDAPYAQFAIIHTRVSLTPSSCLSSQNQYLSNTIQRTMGFKHTQEEHNIEDQIKEQRKDVEELRTGLEKQTNAMWE